MAYCNQGYFDIGTKFIQIGEFLEWHRFQILYNVIRRLGTLSYSFLIFWDCWQNLDGVCAGIHMGRFWYLFLDDKNYWEEEK